MARANLFNREVKANKSPRNAFDLGYSTLFSTPVGLLLPAYVQEVKAGDKMKLNLSNVTRTRPLNTSAFMAFDEKIDFWYVPTYLLWSAYDEWRLAQNFPHSTAQLQNAGTQNLCPFTSYASLVAFLNDFSGAVSSVNPYYTGAHVLRMLDLCLYGAYNAQDISNFTGNFSQDATNPNSQLAGSIMTFYTMLGENNIPINYFRLAAFQCVYMCHYRNEEYEKQDPSYYNLDSLFLQESSNNIDTSAPSNGISSASWLTSGNAGTGSTPPARSQYLPSWRKLMTPRFKNWRKDVFTSAKPNSGFNSVISGIQQPSSYYGSSFTWPLSASADIGTSGSSPSVTTGSPYIPSSPSSLSNNKGYEYLFGTSPSSRALTFETLSGTVSSSGIASVSLYPQQIYNLIAQDKFLRSSVYANKNLADQYKALFGDDYEDTHCPSYLGSFSTTVNISDVTATAAGNDGDTDSLSSSLLGEIAGKGYNTSGKDGVFSRSFDYDGIVIGVHYIMPRNNYDSGRISKFNTKLSRYDYFYPAFDGLGLQPVYMFERNFTAFSRNGMAVNSLFGYAPRFYEYKQRTNEVHNGFQSNQSDRDWTLANNGYDAVTAADFWNYKIKPDITDRIFTVAWNTAPATDPFQCYFNYDVTLISNMEIYGTPSI